MPPNDRAGKYQLIDYVSSKGPFFAFAVLRLSDTSEGGKKVGLSGTASYWTVIPAKDAPEEIQSVQKKISTVLMSKQYSLLDDPVLSQEAEGHFTELDGKPATIFDVLFSEIY